MVAKRSAVFISAARRIVSYPEVIHRLVAVAGMR
jgi:hypothetical protein